VKDALGTVQTGMRDGLPSDLLAIDIRKALFYLGEVTGEVTTDDLLGTIFSKFCIGK
jgi:tRNA modification GTPase